MFCIHVYNTYMYMIYIWVSWFSFLFFCYSTTTTVVLKCVLGFIFQAPLTEDDIEMSENVLEVQAVPLWLHRPSHLSNSDVKWVQLRGSASVAIGRERTVSIRVQGTQAK